MGELAEFVAFFGANQPVEALPQLIVLLLLRDGLQQLVLGTAVGIVICQPCFGGTQLRHQIVALLLECL